ncbi:MAG: Cyclic pyranopterin phosphate synthase (MoaA), partial [uncultured Solirubrobacteraceae bacterium]
GPRAAHRRARAQDLRPARVRDRPLQLPLPVLHARRGAALARALRRALVRGDRARRPPAGADGDPLRAPDGRRAARAPRVPAPGRRAGRRARARGPRRHHERLPARARRRRARRGGDQALQRLDRLPPAGPLLRDDAARRAAAGAARARGAGRPARRRDDQGQRRRAARVHRGGGDPLRRLRPRAPLRGPLHRVHAARRRPHVGARAGPVRRGDPGRDPGRLAARGGPPRAERHRAGVALRRRQGQDRLHQPGLRAVLRGLRPHPPHRGRQAAHLPVLARGDRPARAAAHGRLRRRPGAHRPRRGLEEGAQAPGQRPGLRAARALHERDRRL